MTVLLADNTEFIRAASASSEDYDPAITKDATAAAQSTEHNPLTPRERAVLHLAAEGMSGPEIAKELALSPGTIRNLVSNAMNKMGARSRIDAIQIATDAGWLQRITAPAPKR